MDAVIIAGLLALLSTPAGFLVSSVLLGLIPAAIAWYKGRSFWLFWLYGTLVFVVALPHAILAHRNERKLEERLLSRGEHRRCPHCAEIIKKDAMVCRFCGNEAKEVLTLVKPATPAASQRP